MGDALSRLQQIAILIEISAEYAQMAHDRIYAECGLIEQITMEEDE